MQEILERLERIENLLDLLLQRQAVKDYYSTDGAAEILGKAEFTVREWCRRGRINAQKRRSGRGKYQSWVISHDELQRIQREGLLPEDR
jgi:transposase